VAAHRRDVAEKLDTHALGVDFRPACKRIATRVGTIGYLWLYGKGWTCALSKTVIKIPSNNAKVNHVTMSLGVHRTKCE